MSFSTIEKYLPFLKPLYGLVVFCVHIIAELVAKPAKLFCRVSLKPFPPPMRKISMNTPQNTPNPVRNDLVLFLVMVSMISLYVSMSNLIFL